MAEEKEVMRTPPATETAEEKEAEAAEGAEEAEGGAAKPSAEEATLAQAREHLLRAERNSRPSITR